MIPGRLLMKLFTISFIVCVLLFPSTPISAGDKAAPVLINYQGRLHDSSGNPLSGSHAMTFSLFSASTGGSALWTESHTAGNSVQTDAEGIFNVILNSTGLATGNLATTIRDSTEVWLEIVVGAETLSPRQKLTSSSYALSSPWSGLTGVPAGFQDGTDDYGTAGTGLDESGGSFSVEPSYRLPQDATNGQVAKWDSTSSTWIKGDDLVGTTYSAGSGLTLTGTEFTINFAGTGTADTVSRSDHTHVGQSWSTTNALGLKVETSSVVSGAVAIHGKASGNSNVTAIKGEINTGAQGAIGVYGINNSTTGTGAGVYGRTNSATNFASGVKGYAAGSTGENIGVYGKTESDQGFGVYSSGNAHIEGDLSVSNDIAAGGDIAVTGNVTWGVKTGYITLPASAFQRTKNDRDYEDVGHYYKTTTGSFSAPYSNFAAVQLPHAATITRVTGYFYTDAAMAEGDNRVALYLYRSNFTGTEQQMASMVNGAVPGSSFFELFDDTISNAQINNLSYCYYLEFLTPAMFQINGVTIQYTFTAPY